VGPLEWHRQTLAVGCPQLDLNWPVAKLHASPFGMLCLPDGCTLSRARVLIERSIGVALEGRSLHSHVVHALSVSFCSSSHFCVLCEFCFGRMATVNNNNNSFARVLNQPADNLWTCTAKPMFDKKMADWGKFDNSALTNLRGNNSILLMTHFFQHVANDPPIRRTTKAPHSHGTLKNVLMKTIQKFKEKFEGQTDNLPPLFPDTSTSQQKKIVQHGKSRMLMEGDKEGELFEVHGFVSCQ